MPHSPSVPPGPVQPSADDDISWRDGTKQPPPLPFEPAASANWRLGPLGVLLFRAGLLGPSDGVTTAHCACPVCRSSALLHGPGDQSDMGFITCGSCSSALDERADTAILEHLAMTAGFGGDVTPDVAGAQRWARDEVARLTPPSIDLAHPVPAIVAEMLAHLGEPPELKLQSVADALADQFSWRSRRGALVSPPRPIVAEVLVALRRRRAYRLAADAIATTMVLTGRADVGSAHLLEHAHQAFNRIAGELELERDALDAEAIGYMMRTVLLHPDGAEPQRIVVAGRSKGRWRWSVDRGSPSSE